MKLPFTSGLLIGAAITAAAFDSPIITVIALPAGYLLWLIAMATRKK